MTRIVKKKKHNNIDETKRIKSLLCLLFEKDIEIDPKKAVIKYTKCYPEIIKLSYKPVATIAYKLNLIDELKDLIINHDILRDTGNHSLLIEVLKQKDIPMLKFLIKNNQLYNYVMDPKCVDEIFGISESTYLSKYLFKKLYKSQSLPFIRSFPSVLLTTFQNQLLDLNNFITIIDKWFYKFDKSTLVTTKRNIITEGTLNLNINDEQHILDHLLTRISLNLPHQYYLFVIQHVASIIPWINLYSNLEWWNHNSNRLYGKSPIVDLITTILKTTIIDNQKRHFYCIPSEMTLLSYLEQYDEDEYGLEDVKDFARFLGETIEDDTTKEDACMAIVANHSYIFQRRLTKYEHEFTIEPHLKTDLSGLEWTYYKRDELFVCNDNYIFSEIDFRYQKNTTTYLNPYTQNDLSKQIDIQTNIPFTQWIQSRKRFPKGISRYRGFFEYSSFETLYHIYLNHKKEKFYFYLTFDDSSSYFDITVFDCIRPEMIPSIWAEFSDPLFGNLGNNIYFDNVPKTIIEFFDSLIFILKHTIHSKLYLMRLYMYSFFKVLAGASDIDTTEQLNIFHETPWDLLTQLGMGSTHILILI